MILLDAFVAFILLNQAQTDLTKQTASLGNKCTGAQTHTSSECTNSK